MQMKQSLGARLAALEKHRIVLPCVDLDCGWFRTKLPPDYTGPRETVVVSRTQTAPHIFWCEFEERAIESKPVPSKAKR